MLTTAPAVRLASGALDAAYAPEAGMTGLSLRHRGEELLGPLGIPFLHPWANRLAGETYAAAGCEVTLPAGLEREEHGLAIHGLPPARWEVVEATATRLRAALDFAGHPAFPYPHVAQMDVTLAAGALTVVTTVGPAGARPLPVAFGFHPYFRLPGVAREDWRVGLPAREHLVADERVIPTGAALGEPAEDAPLGARTFDDGSRVGPRARFTLAGGGRTLAVTFLAGYPVAQVYAPPHADVTCFEPMTAPTNALRSGDGLRLVPPGGAFTAAFELRVS